MRSLALALLLLAPLAHSQTLDASAVDARIEALMDAYGTPGVAVAAVQDGRVVYAKGFGYRDVERRLPVTTETAFAIGSVSKQLTAGLIGTYERDGLLSVTDRPAEHIPELRFATRAMDELVTIEDLLAHRSGLGGLDALSVFFPEGPSLRVGRLAHLEPNSAVREQLDYSNVGTALAAAVGERVSGQRWDEEIRDRIFAPLGMTRSGTSVPALGRLDDYAVPYGQVSGGQRPLLFEDLNEIGPGGGLTSTASDLARWAAMLLADGRSGDTQVLTPDFIGRAFSVQSFWSPTYDASERSMNLQAYGYGLGIREFEGRYQVYHSGATTGYTAQVSLLPEEDVAVVVLTNQHVSGIVDWVAEILFREVLGLLARETDSFPVNVQNVRPALPDSSAFVAPPLNTDAPPTHPLSAYVGSYTHPGYGAFRVDLRDGVLYARFPDFSVALAHEQHDVFRMQAYYEIHINTPSFPVNFLTSFDGAVSGADIPFQASGPVAFTRDTEALRADITRQLDAAASLAEAEQSRAVAEALRAGVEGGILSESSVNALGYDYAQADALAMALAVFRFNAEAFPGSWNAHDSLGETLAALDRTAEAVAAYERSLALNPGNANGRAALDRLRRE